jgi:hypothetical protein
LGPPQGPFLSKNETSDVLRFLEECFRQRLLDGLFTSLSEAKLATARIAAGTTGDGRSQALPTTREARDEGGEKGELGPSDIELGRWADGMLPQARHVANYLRANHKSDELRQKFPRFFSEVIDQLPPIAQKIFLEDAQRRSDLALRMRIS